MSQHRKTRNSVAVVPAELIVAHGRASHRAPQAGFSRARVAVAAGAAIASGVVLAGPAAAVPLEIPTLPGLPKIELPPMDVPDFINDGLKNMAAAVGGVVPGPPATMPTDGAFTSGYGPRWGGMHYGIDLASAIGTPIRSVASGTVIEAGPASGFGLWVRVLQDDGTTAVYGHVNEMLASTGQRVNAGQTIATVGNRGDSTGPHLHLEIWNPGGAKVDPAGYLASKGVWRW